MIHLLFFILGLLNVNLQEWIFHQNPLHSRGKHKDSIFHFHMAHHKKVTVNSYEDYSRIDKYLVIDFLSLVFIAILNYFVFGYIFALIGIPQYFPAFFAAGMVGEWSFFLIHTSVHKYPEWGMKYFPWHYDHHIHYPNNNWCVTLPIFDIILGTYKKH